MGIKDVFFKKIKRGYQAAEFSRLTNDWVASFTSADTEIKSAITATRARGRDLGRNNPFVRSWLRSLTNNVVGGGVRMQSNARDDLGNPIESFNKSVEAEFKYWCKKENCHVAGSLSFEDIQRMNIRNVAESGEIYIRKIRKKFGKSKIPLALQILESDMLDVNFNGEYKGRPVRMGVEVDEYNRAIAYHFWSVHPGDLSFLQSNKSNERVRVPAADVIPLFLKERPIQTRGITWLASAAMSLRHLGGFIDATVVGKRVKASVMGFITQPEVESNDGIQTQAGERVEDFAPGKFVHLDPGENVEVPNLGGDSNEFNPFVQAMMRTVAAGVGSSYEEISKDYSQSNYSSSRLSLMSERDNYKALQQWFIRDFLQPVFEEWLELAVMSGVVKLPANLSNDYFLNPEKYNQPKWMPRGWDWVDPQKDIQADILAINEGLKTRAEVLADEGRDFEETVSAIKKEQELLSKNGIILKESNIGGGNETNNQTGS